MPSQQAKAKASPGAAATSAGSVASDFDALTEEEVQFCWKSLVESTQLSVQKLQEFMWVVTGEHLTAVQAKDLLNYMDANEDGVVGREDFRNFVSTGRLQDTNAKDFMWTPKRRYREEHGTVEKQQPKEDDALFGGLPGANTSRSSTLEATPADATKSLSPQMSPRASLEVPGVMSSNLSVDHQPRASRSSAHEPRSLTAKRKKEPKPTRAEQQRLDAEAQATMQPVQAKQEQEKAKQSSATKIDERTKKDIDMKITKYEQQSWQNFLQMEEEFKERLFRQFAADPEGMEVTEYHRMLMKWHKLAKWCMPGDLRAGDSLAALKYILDSERRALKAEAATKGEAAPAVSEAEDDLALPPDVKLTYKTWTDLMAGKYRPDDHHVKG